MTRDEAPAARIAQTVRSAAIVLLLALIALSPWPFGSANPSAQFALAIGILGLVALWAARAIVTRRFTYHSDAVSVCLLGLVVFTAIQLIPIPVSVARAISPKAAEWHDTLLPEVPELLPGETEASAPRRSHWMRLSVAPAATEDLLVQFLAAFLIYAAARNFANDRHSLERLAWVGFATGTALALIAMAQYLSGERERIYWRYDTGGPVFGSFVNKNHFAFQIHLFAGLGIGLFLLVARREGLQSPLAAGLLGGLGLMVAGVGFSQSRGGVMALVAAGLLTWAVARGGTRSDRNIGLALFGGVIVVALALTLWLGWGTVIDRLASFWQGTADNRTPVWRRAWPLVQKFPLAGVGGGGYPVAELATRSAFDGSYISTTAHNEYLEALIEGGVVRFALTVALAIFAVWAAARSYRRTRDPLVLGCVFGLSAVAIHSIGDFGLHVPSVAIASAVVAAYAARRLESGDRSQESHGRSREASVSRELKASAAPSRVSFIPIPFLVLAALLILLADFRSFRIDRLRAAAYAAGTEDAIRFFEAASRVRPNDPDVWEDLASYHLLAATERDQRAFAAVSGFAILPSDVLPGSDPDGHVLAALKAARAGRNAQPLVPGPHLRLGTFANRFARSEPAQVHFDRAKRIGTVEPDVWYVSGKAAAERGDWPAALADWHESLARSPRRLVVIARFASGRVPPDLFREKGLPDDPAIWFAVVPQFLPDRSDPARADWMRAIDARSSRTEPDKVAGFVAWASALEELADAPGAIRVWRRAIERFPDDLPLRDRLAARLEAEERYEEALPVLEWLLDRQPDNGTYGDRRAAAKHALQLKAAIDRP